MFGSKKEESSNELENVKVETPSVFKKNEKRYDTGGPRRKNERQPTDRFKLGKQ